MILKEVKNAAGENSLYSVGGLYNQSANQSINESKYINIALHVISNCLYYIINTLVQNPALLQFRNLHGHDIYKYTKNSIILLPLLLTTSDVAALFTDWRLYYVIYIIFLTKNRTQCNIH